MDPKEIEDDLRFEWDCEYLKNEKWYRIGINKSGSLDKPIDVSNAIHVWVSRKLPGIIIPDGTKQFPED